MIDLIYFRPDWVETLKNVGQTQILVFAAIVCIAVAAMRLRDFITNVYLKGPEILRDFDSLHFVVSVRQDVGLYWVLMGSITGTKDIPQVDRIFFRVPKCKRIFKLIKREETYYLAELTKGEATTAYPGCVSDEAFPDAQLIPVLAS